MIIDKIEVELVPAIKIFPNLAAVGSWQLAVGSWQSAVGSWQSAVGSRQLAVGSRQSAVGSRQSAVGSRQLAVSSQQLTVNLMPLAPSELIINPNGSIYHLNLLPSQIAGTVLFVGDPDRVSKVSKHFDRVTDRVQKREFVTHTGELGGKRLTVISTGIGPDNIDIVMNELDALVNIDLGTRTVKDELTSLNIIRIGTSGSLSAAIPPDDFVVSAFGVGLDNLLHYYDYPDSPREEALRQAFADFAEEIGTKLNPYATEADHGLVKKFSAEMHQGITLTCPGFYAPQGRRLRLGSIIQASFFDNIRGFHFEGHAVTNFEMETAAILGLARMLGHRATACNGILANRILGSFTSDPKRLEETLIEKVLSLL